MQCELKHSKLSFLFYFLLKASKNQVKDCQPGDTVMFYHLGEQIPCLCSLPKDTEILHQVGNKTPTPNPRHYVPVRAETGSLFLLSKQKSCPPRIYALPSSKGQCTALAASQQPWLLQKAKFQPSSWGDAASSLEGTGLQRLKSRTQSQSPCGPAETASRSARSNQIRQFLVSEMLVFMGQNSWQSHNFNKVSTCLKSWSGKCHFSSDSGYYKTNNVAHVTY